MQTKSKLGFATPELLALNIAGFHFRQFQKIISQEIMAGLVKGGAKFIVSVPPGHGKSELCSKWLPLWYLNTYPDRRIIVCSYNQQNADKWGRVVRNLIRDNSAVLNVRIAQDSKAKRYWSTSVDGGFLCAGAGGTLTGNHADLIIIDDPLKNWVDAMSQAKREAVIDWFNTVVSTRVKKNTTFIIIQTRWHENDLSGYLLSQNKSDWKYLRFPAISEGEGDLLGRAAGEPLLPVEYGIEFLEEQKHRLGGMQFAALYQQTPQADTGNIFLRQYWQRYTPAAKPKSFDRVIQSWDTAFETKKQNAYTVCTTWGQWAGRFYLLSIWREKADYPTMKKKMFDLWHSDENIRLILLEDKATGKPLRQELRQAGLPIIEVNPVADKLTRAYSVVPLFEDGKVFAPEGESWADDVIAGCAAYPAGDFADVVDTISQGLTWLWLSSGGLSAGDLLVGKSGRTFRFGKSLSGFSIREKPHWYRDYAKGGRYV